MHTTPSLDLMSLIWSMEKSILDMQIGRNSVPSSPDLIGVSSSLMMLLFNTLHPKSETVLKAEEHIQENLLQKFSVDDCGFDGLREGNDKGREGSSALCRQERSAPTRE